MKNNIMLEKMNNYYTKCYGYIGKLKNTNKQAKCTFKLDIIRHLYARHALSETIVKNVMIEDGEFEKTKKLFISLKQCILEFEEKDKKELCIINDMVMKDVLAVLNTVA